jgi:hypothetical protein
LFFFDLPYEPPHADFHLGILANMRDLLKPGPYLLTILLSATLGPQAQAQAPGLQPGATPKSIPAVTQHAANISPENPADVSTRTLPVKPEASVSGTITDANGADVAGAVVSLELIGSNTERTLKTDDSGGFKFTAVDPGSLRLTVTSPGFTSWVSDDFSLHPNETYELSPVALEIGSAVTSIDVNFTRHDIAEEQMNFEEKQRVLGAIPNFYVSYVWDAPPLSAGQKFRLAVRTSIDPVSIGFSGVVAGVEQAQNDFSGYGQGAQGYAKRFGASYADGFIGTILSDALLPSLLRQDPRYFYKGTGRIRSRVFYAIASVVICRGDNGRWQPNYSNVFGNLAAAGISNVYYPSSDRHGAELTIQNSLIATASGAIGSLFQEFLVKRISRGIQPTIEHEAGN